MDGNITKEGITADLEAMARVGIGGAQIFNVAGGMPRGPIQFNSSEWLELVEHSAREARRLGLELCMHNCAGYSSSGGPWNTPEHGMKVVVASEKQVKGPSHFAGKISQPPATLNFYRDIAVLAFRTPVSEKNKMRDAAPKVTVNGDNEDGSKAADGDKSTVVSLKRPTPDKSAFLQFKFAEPYMARMLTLVVPGPFWKSYSGKIESSDDGQKFRTVRSFSYDFSETSRTLTFTPVSAKVFRVVFTQVSDAVNLLPVAEAEFSSQFGISNLSSKTFATRHDIDRPGATTGVVPDEEVVQGDKIVNLTEKMAADGQLDWNVPEGDWTILRFGYTPNGRINHPAPSGGAGLECDKLSKEAAQAHWDGSMGKILAKLGPLAGDVRSGLNNVVIDRARIGFSIRRARNISCSRVCSLPMFVSIAARMRRTQCAAADCPRATTTTPAQPAPS